MAVVIVPHPDAPKQYLCWKQSEKTHTRCDRKLHHEGLCSWKSFEVIQQWEEIAKSVANLSVRMTDLI